MTSTVTLTTTRASTQPTSIVLQLRLPEHAPIANNAQEPHAVTWDSGVVDNEHMHKRKSKKCCIFHKQRPFDESESEDESDDDGGWELDERGVPIWTGGNSHDHDCDCAH